VPKAALKKNIDLNNELLFLFMSVCLVFVLILTVFNISQNRFKQVLGASVEASSETLSQIESWNSYLLKHPSYLPGYLEIASLENSYGNKEKALMVIAKAKNINPNDNQLKLLEEQIIKGN
jgi:hypothetical protein